MQFKNVVLFFCTSIFAVGYLKAQQLNSASNVEKTNLTSDKTPKEYPFQIELKDSLGQVHLFSDLISKDSKATVLLFWVTTCLPCRMEMDAISEKFKSWKKLANFDFYAISMDNPDREEKFKARVRFTHLPYAAYFDYKWGFKSALEGGLVGLPQVFVLDKNGNVVYHAKKYQSGDEDKLFDKIKSM